MSSARDRLARDRSEARRHPVAVVQIGDAQALVIDYDDASKPYPPDTTSDDWDRVDEWPPVDDGSRARAYVRDKGTIHLWRLFPDLRHVSETAVRANARSRKAQSSASTINDCWMNT